MSSFCLSLKKHRILSPGEPAGLCGLLPMQGGEKTPLNTEKSESPNCFLMCLAAGQLSLSRECECLFMFFTCLICF